MIKYSIMIISDIKEGIKKTGTGTEPTFILFFSHIIWVSLGKLYNPLSLSVHLHKMRIAMPIGQDRGQETK